MFDNNAEKFLQCTEVRFVSFFSGGFNTAIVVNPPEKKLAKRTSVQCLSLKLTKKFWVCHHTLFSV